MAGRCPRRSGLRQNSIVRGQERLLGISKRGDAYLRTLLIHGARSVVTAQGKTDRLSLWITVWPSAVALANKTARMAWAMLKNGTDTNPIGLRPEPWPKSD